MWTISLPLKIACDDRSKPVKHRPGWEQPYFMLNLNQYRNAHHQVLNNAKVNFEIEARKLIRAAGVPPLQKCALEYQLFPGSRQLCDVANVCSVVDKFFSDSLKASKIIQDDNYNFIADLHYKFGQIDRENPRVEVTIRVPQEPATEGKDPMKIASRSIHVLNLTQEELIEAIRKHVKDELFIAPEATVDMKILADGVELRIEQGTLPDESIKTRTRKQQKLEPKEAMANLKTAASTQEGKPENPMPVTRVEERVAEAEAEEAATAAAANQEEQTPSPAPVEPPKPMLICEHCPTALTAENSSKLPGGKVIHVGCLAKPQQEVVKPAPAPVIPPKPYTVPSKEQQLAEAAAAQQENQEEEEQSAPPPPPPVPTKSLFSKYQTPKN